MTFDNSRFRIALVGISLLICLLAVPILHGTFAALVVAILFQVYLPGYLLARLLGRATREHPILTFAWILLGGLALTICVGALARVLSLPVPVYLLILHTLMFVIAVYHGKASIDSSPTWRLSQKSFLFYGLVLVACAVAMGVNYESRNRFYGFEDQSIFISLIDWIADHPTVRPHDVPILSRQIGIINGDIRMATDGWTYIQASWVWTSGVPARQLVWYDISTLFIWTIPLIHFALAYELTRREDIAAWTSIALVLAALMTLDNVIYNPTYTAYGRFVLFQINVNRQASIAMILPLALLSGLTYLRTFKKTDLFITILAGLALASMHPIPTTILVFSLGITALLQWISQPQWRTLKRYIPLGVVLVSLMVLPFAQRFIFFGTKPASSLADLAGLNANNSPDIIFLPQLPLLGTTYIRRPSSVFYSPIILATVIVGLLAGLRWRKSLAAQYIFGTVILALILFFTPGVTSIIDKLGSFITLLSLMFILPVSLALGLGVEFFVKQASRFIKTPFAQGIVAVGSVASIFILLIEPFPINGSARDQLRAFNNMQMLRPLQTSQSALMTSLRSIIPPDAITVFMTPSDIANVILEEVPGVMITGGRDQGINISAAGDARFYTNTTPAAPWLDSTDLNFIQQFGVTHIIMLADSTRLPQMQLSPDRFFPINETDGYIVFQVKPDTRADVIDDLYRQMNELYAKVETPRWDREGFNLVIPGSPEIWETMIPKWQAILGTDPENERAKLGFAYTELMAGNDTEGLPLWRSLNGIHPDSSFYADAEASTQQIVDPSQDSIRPLIEGLGNGKSVTRVLAARRLLTDTFFYHLTSEQLAQIINVTETEKTTWDRLANFDQPNNIRKRAALLMDVGNWSKAREWLEILLEPERSPEDMIALASLDLVENHIDEALSLLRPTTDESQTIANIFLHEDRWQNNTAAQLYYLLLGEIAHREGRDNDAIAAYQQARNFGSIIAAPYFLSQLVPTDQANALLDEAKAAWAKTNDNTLPPLASLLTLADTSMLYSMLPTVERETNEQTLSISALYEDARPRSSYPIEDWRIQVVSPDSSVKYAETVVPAEFVDGALVQVATQMVIPAAVPELAPALIYIEPRFNSAVTSTPLIMPLVLNRPEAAEIPTEADHPDINFGDDIVLQGYSVENVDDHLVVNLYWQANDTVAEDYQVFVHIVGSDEQEMGGQDSAPVNNRYPTTQWRTGLTIADKHLIPYSIPLRQGIYTVEIGLYRLSDNARLTITPASDLVKDNTLTIGRFQR